VHIWSARPVSRAQQQPGVLFLEGRKLCASCGDGAVELVELQLEGRKRMPASAFLNGFVLRDNEAFQMHQESAS
jgi:methionyl-tRNA formyltransferase